MRTDASTPMALIEASAPQGRFDESAALRQVPRPPQRPARPRFGSNLYSVTGFATAGPLEQTEQTQTGLPQNALDVMRTVDASPPFDTTLFDGADLSLTKTDSPDPAHVGQLLTYTLTVKNNGPARRYRRRRD